MMVPNPKTDSIKIFEFEQKALEKMNDVIDWAERVTNYNVIYEWRNYPS